VAELEVTRGDDFSALQSRLTLRVRCLTRLALGATRRILRRTRRALSTRTRPSSVDGRMSAVAMRPSGVRRRMAVVTTTMFRVRRVTAPASTRLSAPDARLSGAAMRVAGAAMRVAVASTRLVVARTRVVARETPVFAAAMHPSAPDACILIADGVVLTRAMRFLTRATRASGADMRMAVGARRLFDADVHVSTFAKRLLAGTVPSLVLGPSLALLAQSRKSATIASKRLIRRVVLERASCPLLARFLEKHAAAFFDANLGGLRSRGAAV
jgi:hypothetical protein